MSDIHFAHSIVGNLGAPLSVGCDEDRVDGGSRRIDNCDHFDWRGDYEIESTHLTDNPLAAGLELQGTSAGGRGASQEGGEGSKGLSGVYCDDDDMSVVDIQSEFV